MLRSLAVFQAQSRLQGIFVKAIDYRRNVAGVTTRVSLASIRKAESGISGSITCLAVTIICNAMLRSSPLAFDISPGAAASQSAQHRA